MATSPSTVTRPAAISSSQARREPRPARARTFCRRSLSVPAGSGVPGDAPASGVVAGRLDAEAQRGTHFALEVARHLGAGEEVLDGRQLRQRVEAESLQEELGRAEERRL